MKKLYTLFLSLCLGSAAFAQSNFKQGHIVDIKGDTIQGLVDDRRELRNAQRVTFQRTADSQKVEYMPTEISSYKVGNKVYISKTIQYNEKPTPAFLELISDGTLQFFFWQDPTDKSHFFIQKNAALYELTNDEGRMQKGGKTYSYNTNAYLGLLNSLTSDCESMPSSTTVNFTLKSISNYVTKYNSCKGDLAYESEKTVYKTRLTKSFYAGANQSFVDGTGEARFDKTGTVNSFMGGAGIHYAMPNGKLFFDLMAEYNRKGGEAEKERINFTLHYINVIPGISYVYPKGKIRPTVGAGFVAGYLLNKESAYIRTSYERQIRMFYRTVGTGGGDSEEVMEIGYQLRAGVKYALTDNLQLLLLGRYSKTMIPFGFNTSMYYNQVASVQVGIEF